MEKEKNINRTEEKVSGNEAVETQEPREKAVRIGALWNRTSENGKNYKSGVVDFGPLGELHVALFQEEKKGEKEKKNENGNETEKNESKRPDFVLVCEKNRIGAFWIRISKAGNKFLSGCILGVPVNVFKNERKTSDKAPDYRIVMFTEATEETAEGDF